MNHREWLKLLFRSPIFYLGILMLVVGIILFSIFDSNPPIIAAILAQGGFIVCLWANWRTRFIITDPASQNHKRRRFRMGVTLGVGMICIGFILTPVVMQLEIPKMPGVLFWYAAVTGFIGLLGLVGLIIWLKRSSD